MKARHAVRAASAISGGIRCRHKPPCPPADQPGRLASVVIVAHPEQGWSLLCNGIIVFDDTGALVGGRVIPPQRAAARPQSRNARVALPAPK
jgi:hypothetical protein